MKISVYEYGIGEKYMNMFSYTYAGIGSVKQQTEQVSDSMDKDGTPDVDEISSLLESKTRTEPEQVATHSAPLKNPRRSYQRPTQWPWHH